MTMDRLARLMQDEFSNMRSETRSEFAKIYEVLKIHSDQFSHVQSDITAIKTTLGPLVQMVGLRDREINSLNLRLNRVERKVGITSLK